MERAADSGVGAIAIVAPRGEALDGVMEQLINTIRWPA
jgi:hypothetical protein